MPNNSNNNIELRAESVQDILTKTPHWMLRWGNLIILSILILIFFFSWLIKYPDIVTTEITITSSIPPEKIIAHASGRFDEILVKDQEVVLPNTHLAIIENTANYQDVLKLKSVLNAFSPEDSLHFPIQSTSLLQLGNIGQAYTQFEKEYTAFYNYSSLNPHRVTLSAQNLEKSEWQQRYQQLKQQQEITSNETDLKRKEYQRFKTLFEKGVISAQEFERKEVEYLQQEKMTQNLKTQISQMQSTYNQLQADQQSRQIVQKQDNVNYKRSMILAYYQLQRSIKDWEQQFVLKSTIKGQVSFLSRWARNQQVNAGEEVFGVVDLNAKDIIGKAKAQGDNVGKIKVNQIVTISLTNFPEREFGRIHGKVSNISRIPDKEGNLYIDVKLPKQLSTNYKKNLPFQQEMSGRADIVTQDLRLIERFFYQFRDIYARN
jgi:multidrug resistance efflux pump